MRLLQTLPALAMLVSAAMPRAETLASWVEATGDSASLRAVATGACPGATADGAALALASRAVADAGFPELVCQAALPPATRAAAVDDAPVPVWPRSVRRIVVIGDTGCRLKGSFVQDCDDPVKWPFAAVAARAAAEQPDLVIHVGDYYYRETPCPAERAGCAGSPSGDAWTSWQADFFTPAKPLLAAAPWIFVRGNHEQCGRGALGWFRMLDAGPEPLACPASSRSFAVPIGRERLIVVDSADTEDASAPAAKVALFRDELAPLRKLMASGDDWILTHRPIWGFVPERSGAFGETDELAVNRTEQAAVAGEQLGGVRLILSGHVHVFAAADFGPGRPAQLIVGNGGDTRDGELPRAQAHRVRVAGLPADAFLVEQFGYLVLDRVTTGWSGVLKGVDGRLLARCGLAGRDIACAAAET
jgi:predicted phosphodiesterase